ncbi:MAG TPA: aldolase/citrate lyase family protein [Burkholderiales bacterium]|nr:aldolase/citrate lyase family protein [Burkholderiales bacterium]
MSDKTKQQLLSQKIISVCNPDFPTAEMVEFMGELGFDMLFIDCEHSTTDFKLVGELARAARLAGMGSVLRPWSNEPGLINRYLSCGAGGIQAPHVHNIADANRILEGLRRWGDGDYREKLLLMMVESQEAVDNLPALLKIPEIDVFYIGQNDLAESMGLKGQRKHAKVKAVVEDTIKRVSDAGKIPGMNVQDEIDAARHYIGLGLRWINVHQKQFIARGSKDFLRGIKGDA